MAMKPRARRIALLTMAAACLLVAGLVALNWDTVRDHAEAWRFVWTTETGEVQPHRQPRRITVLPPYSPHWEFLFLATSSGRPVIFERDAVPRDIAAAVDDRESTDEVLQNLRRHGYRILEQVFPRPAYVVVGYPGAAERTSKPLVRSGLGSR
jgi:hypothetical protein